MGKIRIKSYDEEEQKKQDERKKAKKEAKVAGKKEAPKAEVTPVEEVRTEQAVEEKANKSEKLVKDQQTKGKKKAKFAKKKAVSKRYSSNASHVKKDGSYAISEAIETLRKFQKAAFDETVELHINTKEKGLSGQLMLPHGTGKQLKVVIADDAIISQVEKGKINFDMLVATPQMMPKLAKVARILGPKGLMPNPKAGTISTNPEETVKKLSAGQVNYKTESEGAVIHLSVGKLSFEDKQLTENVAEALKTIGATKIVSVTLKSTMSPGIRVQV